MLFEMVPSIHRRFIFNKRQKYRSGATAMGARIWKKAEADETALYSFVQYLINVATLFSASLLFIG
ncbi:MAG: hypothetical protein D6733_03465 [Methanobacteriota archaeon]|nr:MAG: hypothetical protein D6733_03465 [Euryarchaeota archaeon]